MQPFLHSFIYFICYSLLSVSFMQISFAQRATCLRRIENYTPYDIKYVGDPSPLASEQIFITAPGCSATTYTNEFKDDCPDETIVFDARLSWAMPSSGYSIGTDIVNFTYYFPSPSTNDDFYIKSNTDFQTDMYANYLIYEKGNSHYEDRCKSLQKIGYLIAYATAKVESKTIKDKPIFTVSFSCLSTTASFDPKKCSKL